MAVDLATTTRYLTNLRKHFADLVQEYLDEDMPLAAASARRDLEEIDKLLDNIRCRILNKRTVNELSKQMGDSSTRMVPRMHQKIEQNGDVYNRYGDKFVPTKFQGANTVVPISES